jgi:glycerol uptake facilitator-like aquaporin
LASTTRLSTPTGAAPTPPSAGQGLYGSQIGANIARAGVAEVIGTFLLVFTGTAVAVSGALGRSIAGAPADSLAVALAFGLVLVALASALGHICGAHFNPAVTLALAVTGKFPWRYTPAYLVAQLVGAVLAALAVWACFGGAARDKAALGATTPASGVSVGQVLLVEVLITFLLVLVIISVATTTGSPRPRSAQRSGSPSPPPCSSAARSPVGRSTPPARWARCWSRAP